PGVGAPTIARCRAPIAPGAGLRQVWVKLLIGGWCCRSRDPAAMACAARPAHPSAAQTLSGVQQQPRGTCPAQTAVGDRHAVLQLSSKRLIAIEQVTLQHDRSQIVIAGQTLTDHIVQYLGLAHRVLAAVGVTAVNHDRRLDAGPVQLCLSAGYADRVEVRPLRSEERRVGTAGAAGAPRDAE